MALDAAPLLPDNVPANLVVDFDVYAPAEPGEDFHAAWARFQKSAPGPLVWSPRYGGHWIAVRGEDVMDIHADHARFSSAANTVPQATSRAPLGAITMDPPDHGAFRAFLDEGISPRVVRSLEPGVRALTVSLIEAFQSRGQCDFIAEFADVLPLTVFLNLVAVPLEDRLKLARWASQVTRETNVAARDQASRNLRDYLRPLIAERRAAPGEDMLSRVAMAQIDGRPITEAEAVGACTHLMIAGLDTVSSLLGFVMRFLAGHPEHRRALAREPRRIPQAVKEMIRRFPLVVMSREVREDLELHGVRLRRGDMITVPTMLYNLDESIYPEPLAVDWRRPVLATCTFGHGPHRCAGAPLGQREVVIALEEWLARIPDFEVPPGEAITVNGGVVAVLDRLPLRWAPPAV
jgi:camphor 5-monooxygenase